MFLTQLPWFPWKTLVEYKLSDVNFAGFKNSCIFGGIPMSYKLTENFKEITNPNK